MWDTGAGITIVDRAWAVAHPEAVTIEGVNRQGTDVTGAAVAGTGGTLARCTIGGREFPVAPCAVVDLSSLNARMTTPINIFSASHRSFRLTGTWTSASVDGHSRRMSSAASGLRIRSGTMSRLWRPMDRRVLMTSLNRDGLQPSHRQMSSMSMGGLRGLTTDAACDGGGGSR